MKIEEVETEDKMASTYQQQLGPFVTWVIHELIVLHTIAMMYILSVNRHLYTSIHVAGAITILTSSADEAM